MKGKVKQSKAQSKKLDELMLAIASSSTKVEFQWVKGRVKKNR